MTKVLTDAQFEQETSQGLTVVDFWAPWCGPCRMQAPVIDELSEELDGQVDFYKMNVDEEQKVAQQFGIMSIPTLLVKKDGEVVEKLVGFHDKNRLNAVLARYM
ncbi:thioredoxin [Tuanshanicoccus lijuaniae]|uniref:thioredoxin n=1 Tax=Aerococcaceae bacterium zg-1292 TaxID=2774330 RepID=UPI001938EAD6|nr:thioredoxin [Aerococcaceae bacterium zg-1292]MBF6625528.1 thioredoxin [Aerococcaceae bacterium zg-BR9]MBF6977716.1 thioredoxin [Aerococcaceae bacterium zg-BR22]MBS4457061.1 thioredoxin [Aerococcaceae bacterium zg-A91]MBS4458910.1 thioredoxin [Aerococcaceae bacterium zg-BR33]